MNGFLFLLCCIEVLGALLCGAQSNPGPITADFSSSQTPTRQAGTFPASQTPSLADLTSVATQSLTTVSQDSSSHSTSPLPGPKPTDTLIGMFYRRECLSVFMVAGGLIVACTILLVSTLLLIWKVCQLSRRIKMLSNNADLISTSEYWMGTAKRNKGTSEAEAKETTVLMADISQTQEDMGNGTTKEEGGEVNEDGQTGGENKEEVGDAAESEESATTPVTVAENAASSKPQDEAAESTKAVAASSSKATEEPKDVV